LGFDPVVAEIVVAGEVQNEVVWRVRGDLVFELGVRQQQAGLMDVCGEQKGDSKGIGAV
jgi:hypothetical protein